MEFVIGIDVGGKNKGYHAAVIPVGSRVIQRFFHEYEPQEIIRRIKDLGGTCLKIAVDSPRKSRILGPETRLAERDLHRAGYRLQWTPRPGRNEQGWMKNGERLWNGLRKAFGTTKLIETFPTAASDGLADVEIEFPLKALAGKEKRPFYKDYIDASICAIVAREAFRGKTRIYGRDDELGPIHVL